MKNILIPTDFSECANNATEYGIYLAKKANAEIHFLHIMNTPVEWIQLSTEEEKNYPKTLSAIGHAKLELNRLEKKARRANLKVKQYLVYDQSSDEIITHLKHYKCDFIVMGSHGIKGWREFLIGSNAQKVVRYSPVPVLTVKGISQKPDFKDILFASNFSKDVDAAFVGIINLAKVTGAHLHLLYVNVPNYFEETEKSRLRMNLFLKKCPKGSCTAHIRNALNEERGIMNFRKEIKADLISLATHGKVGAMRMLSYSIAEVLTNHAVAPVLTMNMNIKQKQ